MVMCIINLGCFESLLFWVCVSFLDLSTTHLVTPKEWGYWCKHENFISKKENVLMAWKRKTCISCFKWLNVNLNLNIYLSLGLDFGFVNLMGPGSWPWFVSGVLHLFFSCILLHSSTFSVFITGSTIYLRPTVCRPIDIS